MPRKPRDKGPGLLHHVVHRGINRQAIVRDNQDRKVFLRIFAFAARKHQVDVLAYCLMDNHYHVMVHDPYAHLSQVFHAVGSFYTTAYNRRYACEGELLRGRYFSKPVYDEAYELCLFRYIHLNPVKAGIVAQARQYRWSSYRAYACVAHSELVATQRLLAVLQRAGIARTQLDAWLRCANNLLDPPCPAEKVLGWLQEKEKDKQRAPSPLCADVSSVPKIPAEVVEGREVRAMQTLRKEALVQRCRQTANQHGVPLAALAMPRRGNDPNAWRARNVAMLLCRREEGASNREIALLFSLAEASVDKTLWRARQHVGKALR